MVNEVIKSGVQIIYICLLAQCIDCKTPFYFCHLHSNLYKFVQTIVLCSCILFKPEKVVNSIFEGIY